MTTPFVFVSPCLYPYDKMSKFRKYCQDKVNDYSIHPNHVINMDEVPLTFDLHMNLTVEKTGSSTISIKTTGHEKASFTCVLACTASRIHLPPMLIFKRKTMPKEKLPRGVIIKVNEKGWMSNSMLKSWVTECFAKRPDGFFHRQRAFLVMDSKGAHITDDVKDLLHSVNQLLFPVA